jgi:tetratricopeptide (TPR) repeat protein
MNLRRFQPKSLQAASWRQQGRAAAVCVALAAITFAVFGQTLGHEFVNFDDETYVSKNPMVTPGLTGPGIVWAFLGVRSSNWHPLTWLSHMLDCELYGLHPAGHHLTNVLLHTATVIALFLLLRQMTGALWRSAFVAAVFAIHPLRVESVAWVAERKDVLSGLFFMLTLAAYVRYARRPWSPARYGLVLLLFALGLLCKPMLVTLPVVLLLLDYWPLQRAEPAGKLMLEKLPLLALSAASCIVTLAAQSKAIQSAETFSLPLRLENALVSCMIYLGQMVWPVGLVVFYPYPRHGFPLWEVALAGALLVGFSALAWLQRRKRPWLMVGWAWYLVMLLPVAGIIQVGMQAHADRYTYLPQIGIYAAVAWWAAEWRISRAAFGALMAAVVGALMAGSRQQTAYWQDSETLWTRALACTSDNTVAEFNFGSTLLLEGKVDQAITHYQNALNIDSDFADARCSLGNAYSQKGKPDEAMVQYLLALRINPALPSVHNNLGTILVKKGQADKAIAEFRNALQINPDFPEARHNLGNALLQKGDVDGAITQYRAALDADPDYPEAHNALGDALLQQGKLDQAITEFRRALSLKPDYAKACNNLGGALLQKGQVNQALENLQRAVTISPDLPQAHYNLGNAFVRLGRMADATAHFQKAVELKPAYAEAHLDLGNVLLQIGRLDEAIAHYQQALQTNPAYFQAQFNLGNALLRKGDAAQALPHFQQALQLEPNDAATQNTVAWLLATWPDASVRDGRKAVALARAASEATGGKNPMVLQTLAAALAETGQFSEAVETAQRALSLAEAQSNTRLAGQLRLQLNLYQAGKPFHVPAQPG